MDLTVVIIGESGGNEQHMLPEQIKKIICPTKEEAEKQICAVSTGWVMLMQAGDRVSEGFWQQVLNSIQKYPSAKLLFGPRSYRRSRQLVEFSGTVQKPVQEPVHIVYPDEASYLHSWFLEGTIIHIELAKELFASDQYASFTEMYRLLCLQRSAAEEGRLLWLPGTRYELTVSKEGDKTFFPGIYQREWYEELVERYLLRRKKETEANHCKIPEIEQYQMAFLMNAAVEANLNNVNKHLYEGEKAVGLLRRFGTCLKMIAPEVLLDREHFVIAGKNAYLRRWVYLILRQQNPSLEFDWIKENGGFVYCYEGIRAGSFEDITADIISMEYSSAGVLTIEGRVSPLAYMNGSRFLIYAGDQAVEPQKKERYALTKAFGISIYKLQSFHAEIPVQAAAPMALRFVMEGKWGSSGVRLEFDSHFSRLSNTFPHSYWQMAEKTMLVPGRDALYVRSAGRFLRAAREIALWMDMLKTGQKKVIKYIPVRMMMLRKPLLRRKPIWLFMDKIYKGGDSSEYLWRYVKDHDRDVKALYLLDKESPDFKSMREAGYKPLIRQSLAHRRAFLLADWVIISNSTLFAFNDFSTKNSAYIRDLIGFKVACVQHGMSVQKIAVAQNRLRDNISLYFCASKYEIENLSKPVYDYAGYDILKLTGVPRYDGLISQDRRQILISPTWRMQAAVPVTKNESVMRDYNPLFKQSSYYQVYNSLINDPRLLAAAKQYGYRIVYVLHPIVSAQLHDFTENEYVTILQGGGDMSYEKILCESSLMVTDYSGVQFDFAYMRKPVVYLHHRDIPQHYEEGTFHYDTMAFGEICHDNRELVSLLTEYMQGGCKMKEEYKNRADDFFAYNDHQNCARIYEILKQEASRR